MSRLGEFRSIIQSVQAVWGRGKKATIVMLIGVNGSAYRLPGTKMMMAEDGEMIGTISGGCLESDIYAYAEKAIEDDTPMIKNYDLSESEIWGLGIGCKGSLEILILPVQEEDPFWKLTEKFLHQEEDFCFITEVPSGVKAIIAENKEIIGDNGLLPAKVYEKALLSLKKQTRAEIIDCDGGRFVIDVIRPSQRLIVAGAGKDAIPVVDLAAKSGFSVTVLDTRSEFNNNRYFPNAVPLIRDPEMIDPMDVENSWWVVMNHLQYKDEAVLDLALKSSPKYIGVLGPISRTEEMIQNIRADATVLDTIHSPIGLDIGAETMEEVAISIVSELLTIRNNRTGNSLKGKVKIHA